MLEKIKVFLKEYDFIWSTPLAFGIFILFPYVGQSLFGNDFAFYPPSFFHAGIYAALLTVFANSVVQMGILFNFPEMYEFYHKQFNELQVWQKSLLFSVHYFFYFLLFFLFWVMIV
jgi:hypothetical protein